MVILDGKKLGNEIIENIKNEIEEIFISFCGGSDKRRGLYHV